MDDIVIGEFLGDSDLVLYSPSAGASHIVIALPIYGRSEWPSAAPDLVSFLSSYLEGGGDKFWEPGAMEPRV